MNEHVCACRRRGTCQISRRPKKQDQEPSLCAGLSAEQVHTRLHSREPLSRKEEKRSSKKKPFAVASARPPHTHKKVCSPCLPLHPRGAPPGRSRHELGSCRRAGSPTAACCALAQGQRAAGAAAVHAPAQHAARSSLDDQLAAVVATRSLVALPCTAALGRAGSGSRGGQQLTQLSFV